LSDAKKVVSRLQSEQVIGGSRRGAPISHRRKNSEKSEEAEPLNLEGLDDDGGEDVEGQNPFSKNKGRRPQTSADEDDAGDD